MLAYGTDAQKAEWVDDLMTGKKNFAYGITEPNHGSDATHMETTAAAFNYQADRASANADEAGLELDVAHDQQEDGIAVLRDAHTDYQRVVTRMQTWLTTQQQTTSAMVAHLSA